MKSSDVSTVHLYLAFHDIPPIIQHGSQTELHRQMNKDMYVQRQIMADARYGLFQAWLQQMGLGAFPKNHADFVRSMSPIAGYSRESPSTFFVFSMTTHCFVLNKGLWSMFDTFPDALQSIFGLAAMGSDVLRHSVFTFPLGASSMAMPVVPAAFRSR